VWLQQDADTPINGTNGIVKWLTRQAVLNTFTVHLITRIHSTHKEISKATGRGELDAVIDCAGAEEMIRMGFELLSIAGHYASVGLVGDRINIPLFPMVAREYTYHGSFWGNYNDLSEVMSLAAQGKIRHTVKTIAFEAINENLALLRTGDIVGRAVIKF
jgi:propanol-preferring alcohol dehydrogenase